MLFGGGGGCLGGRGIVLFLGGVLGTILLSKQFYLMSSLEHINLLLTSYFILIFGNLYDS